LLLRHELLLVLLFEGREMGLDVMMMMMMMMMICDAVDWLRCDAVDW